VTTGFLRDDVAREEGCVLEAYPDPRSALAHACAALGLKPTDYRNVPGWRAINGAPWTIGFGSTGPDVKPGLVWTQAQADSQLDQDIARCCAELDKAIPWWRMLSDPRQDVLVQMVYQLGLAGMLGFHNMLTDLQRGDVDDAADEMGASLWARQTSGREQRLAEQLRSGMRAAA
jgi:lysozyme